LDRQEGSSTLTGKRRREIPATLPAERDAPTTTTKAVPFPDGWVAGPAELAVAADLAGWDPVGAELEFGKFRDYHREEKQSRKRNWGVAWKTWCRDGRTYDSERGPRRSTSNETGLKSALLGLNEWVVSQTTDKPDEQS
jgi:hypothetical protein